MGGHRGSWDGAWARIPGQSLDRRGRGAQRSCPGTRHGVWELRLVIRLDKGQRGLALELKRDPSPAVRIFVARGWSQPQ